MPTYPGSGSTVAKGTYYVTTTYARGNTFVLNAIVSVGSNTVSVSRLVQLNGAVDIMSNAVGLYSLRKAKSSYSGYAVNVRCASNPSGATTADIGFDGSGNLNIAALKTCLGDSTLPLDVTTGAKLAYGLRKLSSSYSGYVDTWYDQSGSGKDISQSTTTKQPRIVNAGVIDLKNSMPAAYFDGSDDSMSNTALGGSLITGNEIRSFMVSSTESGGSNSSWGEFAVIWKSGDPDAFSTASSMELLTLADTAAKTATTLGGASGLGTGLTTGVLYQHTAYHDASNNLRLYRNGTLKGSASISASLAPTSVILGTSAGSDANTNGRGYITELIVFNASLSSTNQQAIERNQEHYYNISGVQDGFVTTWYDQSGNGRNATQSTTSLQPILSQVALVSPTSGKLSPGVTFDGTDDYVVTAASTAWPSGAGNRTMSGVYQLNGLPATNVGTVVLFWGGTSNGTSSALAIWNGSGGGDGFMGWGGAYNFYSNNTIDTSQAHRSTATYNGTTCALYLNGSATNSGALTLNTTSNTSLGIGRAASGTYPYYINGSIAEAVVFNAVLSSTQASTLDTAQTAAFGN